MTPETTDTGAATGATREFVTMTINGQLFGLPVLSVHDVLGPQRITRIPLAPKEVAGALNLRGRIVTAIDVRQRLGLGKRDDDGASMSVVVECRGEMYSLMIDSVGEVLSVPVSAFERNPPTLAERWRQISAGVYRLADRLLVELDVERLFDWSAEGAT